ncbi:hypothetical protein [Bacillus alkalicellulosilyticus]|uniref:hypothetical protein n=1 Tax=Alkalihalobacterium alkalicellulosilyticum TaxID=1912214 RepID=UPI0009968590|nr:hypothetical protein [Bacillus alkalicellulosilyticus]
MERVITLIMISFLFLLIACSEQELLSDNGEIAKNHLIDLGYEILSIGQISQYQFNGSVLDEQIWGVQAVEREHFLNKKIDTISFEVKNHPLDDMFGTGKTMVTVFLDGESVIGGWSFPIAEEELFGAPYSLDGKTAEELQDPETKEEINIYGMESFTKIMDDSLIVLQNPLDIKLVKDSIKTAVKQPGIFDMTDPDFLIDLGVDSYFLWLDDTSGVIMNTNETHTIFILSEEYAIQIFDIVTSQN